MQRGKNKTETGQLYNGRTKKKTAQLINYLGFKRVVNDPQSTFSFVGFDPVPVVVAEVERRSKWPPTRPLSLSPAAAQRSDFRTAKVQMKRNASLEISVFRTFGKSRFCTTVSMYIPIFINSITPHSKTNIITYKDLLYIMSHKLMEICHRPSSQLGRINVLMIVKHWTYLFTHDS